MKIKEGIAIIGMNCKYPGSDNIYEFWNNILALRQQFRNIPSKRLNLEYYGEKNGSHVDLTYLKKAALLTNYEFDRVKFRISKSMYEATDLVHWLALEVADGLLKDAGYENGKGLNKDKVAVIIGNTLNGEFSRANAMRLRWPYVYKVMYTTMKRNNYEEKQIFDILREAEINYKKPFPEPNEETLAGGLSNTISGRICNYYDFRGGGYSVDGACASSLLALVNGCESLINRDLEYVIVGGVDVSIDPFEIIGFTRTGALAKKEMKVFGDEAEGFFPGEGCGMVMLMRESEAISKKLNIYSVIRGYGMSTDGKGGITRPKIETQKLALNKAYRMAPYDIKDVNIFEAHGTGTAIGDEVELSALIQCLKGSKHPAVLGSIKQLIGHTKAASGIAGIIKAALSLKNNMIPPTISNYLQNSLLRDNGAVLSTSKIPLFWNSKKLMKAGVSSFGFGGLNIHVTLEEAKKTTKIKNLVSSTVREFELFTIAADLKESFLSKIEKLIYCSKKISGSEFIDLACSLNID